jgi:hypothetical protein
VLEEIVELSELGVNAVGIRYILQMRQEVRILRQEVQEARGRQHRVEDDRQEQK